MKCKIFISKNSNNLSSCAHLKNAILYNIENYFETSRNITIYFDKKRDAQKALKTAFENLKFNEPEYFKNGGIRYGSGVLRYDAALATIENCS